MWNCKTCTLACQGVRNYQSILLLETYSCKQIVLENTLCKIYTKYKLAVVMYELSDLSFLGVYLAEFILGWLLYFVLLLGLSSITGNIKILNKKRFLLVSLVLASISFVIPIVLIKLGILTSVVGLFGLAIINSFALYLLAKKGQSIYISSFKWATVAILIIEVVKASLMVIAKIIFFTWS